MARSDPTKIKKIQPTPPPDTPTPTPDLSTPVSAIPGKQIVYTGHTDAVQAVTWSPDGLRIASAGIDAQVHVWDAWSGQRYLTCIGHTDIIQAVSWSPDGQYIASGSRDHTVRIWDAKTGQVISVYTGHPLGVNTLCWSPLGTGPLLVSGSDDPVVHVWSAPDARLIQTHSNAGKGNPSRINTVSWGNLEFIISGGEDTYIQPWGAPNSQGAGMGIYGIYSGPVLALAWAPGYVGRRLPLVGITEEDSMLCCWPFGTTTATWMVSLPGISHPGSPQKGDITWSSDSQWIAASLSSSSTVSIFDAPMGTSHFIYHGHTGGVNAVSCSPAHAGDGTLCIASGSMDKTVHVWQWKP